MASLKKYIFTPKTHLRQCKQSNQDSIYTSKIRERYRGRGGRVERIWPWAVDIPWWTHAANYSGHAPRMASVDDLELVVAEIVKACADPKEEMPVGPKAKALRLSHAIFPNITERMSATLAQKESKKATEVAYTNGVLFSPMQEEDGVSGGIRERMKQEDEKSSA